PRLSDIFDEPFADPSQIPQYLVSKLARNKVTVVLSGDGGDELFGGYHRYLYGEKVWNFRKYTPLPLRKLLGKLKPNQIANWFSEIEKILPRSVRLPNGANRVAKFVDALTARQSSELC